MQKFSALIINVVFYTPIHVCIISFHKYVDILLWSNKWWRTCTCIRIMYSLLSQHHHLHEALLQRWWLTFMVLVSAAEKSSLLSPALLSTSSFFWTRGLKKRPVTFTSHVEHMAKVVLNSWHKYIRQIKIS